ncbi:NRAMP family divalent metal transporter [Virgibacillus alimentarius]|uniref:Mn2+/Fe2+ NRAMP family transporter n=1 Tax=Virgibacillus alimentarius TaxID=698769 RepID=A0ABS4SBA9_9BACI|nr:MULTISPECIES: NRAMP family divalent metal transporter [Virgibacillus]MBP2258169.1 Mn2+/Fe2+ NRAMP family transporter [Virgibacillus alimentarius]HLR69322.1 NRAMP family divalent metal transporter [Virgibacillus sp.]
MNSNHLQPDKPIITKGHKRLIWGAIFLMATSSIGPAFLTQTTVFTEEFAANFAFAILASVIIDIGAQLNIWRILVVSGKRGQDVANLVLPGLGSVIAILIVIGGLAFNIGNVAGGGLGLNVLFGVSTTTGAIITGILAVIIFLLKDAGKAMDIVALTLGSIMLIMVGYVMLTTNPPVAEAMVKSVFPDDYKSLVLPVITLVGGTVGGYITFAGGHRLLDAGVNGKENLPVVNRAANYGILTTGVMRIFLFLAVLGVVAAGYKLDASNPPASVFQIALGDVGYKIFGLVLWSAALTSVVGSAYTSVSFLRSFHQNFEKYNKYIIIGFILFSTIVFAVVGKPVTILVIVGSLNGLILPLTLGSILIASRKKEIVGDYHHPTWMIVFGIIAVIITLIAGWFSLEGIAELWTG